MGGACLPAATATGNQSGVKGEQVQGGDSLYAPISWQMAEERFAPEQSVDSGAGRRREMPWLPENTYTGRLQMRRGSG